MRTCNDSLTSLQRRTIALIGAAMACYAALSLTLRSVPANQFLAWVYSALAFISAAPVILTLVVIARYLRRESDEYLRGLVVRSILWAFGLVMIADTVIGYLIAYQAAEAAHLRSLGVFNLELFVVAAAIALRVQLWRNR